MAGLVHWIFGGRTTKGGGVGSCGLNGDWGIREEPERILVPRQLRRWRLLLRPLRISVHRLHFPRRFSLWHIANARSTSCRNISTPGELIRCWLIPPSCDRIQLEISLRPGHCVGQRCVQGRGQGRRWHVPLGLTFLRLRLRFSLSPCPCSPVPPPPPSTTTPFFPAVLSCYDYFLRNFRLGWCKCVASMRVCVHDQLPMDSERGSWRQSLFDTGHSDATSTWHYSNTSCRWSDEVSSMSSVCTFCIS